MVVHGSNDAHASNSTAQLKRKCVALKRKVAELQKLNYTRLYQIDHRDGPVSRTFELRIEISKQLTQIIRTSNEFS